MGVDVAIYEGFALLAQGFGGALGADMPMGDGSMLGYVVGGDGILLAVGQMAWSQFFGEGRARGDLIQQLTDRIGLQEQRMFKMETALDDERKLRRAAEDKVQAMEFYTMILQGELRKHSIEVPRIDELLRTQMVWRDGPTGPVEQTDGA